MKAPRRGSRVSRSMVAFAAVLAATAAVPVASTAGHARRSQFAHGACVSFQPLDRPNGHSVYLDPGHGGIDRGAAGRTTAGRRVFERQLTLAIGLKALRLLRAEGFTVTLSRITDTTVAPPRPRELRDGGLTVAADQRELRARIDCANPAHAQLFLGIHFEAVGQRSLGGAETIYSRARRFAAGSLRLAQLVQTNVVDALRRDGRRVSDGGVKSDAGQGRSALDADALATIVRAARRHGYGSTTLPQAYATAFPRWAARPRRWRPGDHVPPDDQALERFIHLGLPLYCGGSRRRVVALTFDDGPGPASGKTLALLRRSGAQGTFFLIGENLRDWPQLPRAEAALGAVGDHTWTHPFLTHLSTAAIQREVASTQAALQRAIGAPVMLFRPPYGFHDAAVDREVHHLGMLQVLWSLDSRDSYPPPGASAAQIVHTLKTSLHPGSIVLLHENLPQTELALPSLLRLLQTEDLTAVSIPELLAFDPPTQTQLRQGIYGCPGANA